MLSPSPRKEKKKKSRNWSVWEGTNASLWSWSPFPQQKQEVRARRNLKAAICQKHCEKLWGIHWKQMGFFSLNSEILSLSDTIKTNRGRRGMLSNRGTGWSARSAWAPRVGPRRAPAVGGVGDLAGTSGAPPAPPPGARQVCKLVGEEPRKVPPAPSPRRPCSPSSGAPE